MKNGYTHIEVVLDRSGSMQPIQSDVIGGFNKFLEEQKAVPGEATISLVQFDDKYEPNYNLIPIKNAKNLTIETYVPRGMTALLDAVGKTITKLGEKLASMNENDRPSKVIFVIQTDGYENASREFSFDQVKSLIEKQEKQFSWQFLFLGAGLDVAKQGASIGIANFAAYNSTPYGVAHTYTVSSNAVTEVRKGIRASVTLTTSEKDSITNAK